MARPITPPPPPPTSAPHAIFLKIYKSLPGHVVGTEVMLLAQLVQVLYIHDFVLLQLRPRSLEYSIRMAGNGNGNVNKLCAGGYKYTARLIRYRVYDVSLSQAAIQSIQHSA